MPTTLTDKPEYKVTIIDIERFTKLTDEKKKFFEIRRNSFLEICPLNDKQKHDESFIKIAENFAFIGIELDSANADNIKKLEARIVELEKLVATQKSQSQTP